MTETAIIGGGCFWCIEPLFVTLKGVVKVESGYTGGKIANPTYKEICTGQTGHAEVIRITYHPDKISYRELLDIFFTVHDPTTLNRQGNDTGTQYRSVIFYGNEAQEAGARAALEAAQNIWSDKIVTEIKAAEKFYVAEDYHQNYYNENPFQPYCSIVIAPKVKKFRAMYLSKQKES